MERGRALEPRCAGLAAPADARGLVLVCKVRPLPLRRRVRARDPPRAVLVVFRAPSAVGMPLLVPGAAADLPCEVAQGRTGALGEVQQHDFLRAAQWLYARHVRGAAHRRVAVLPPSCRARGRTVGQQDHGVGSGALDVSNAAHHAIAPTRRGMHEMYRSRTASSPAQRLRLFAALAK